MTVKPTLALCPAASWLVLVALIGPVVVVLVFLQWRRDQRDAQLEAATRRHIAGVRRG